MEHNFQGEESTAGTHLSRHYRDARRWFSYDLKTEPGEQVELQVTYYGGDRRQFDILINDQLMESVELAGGQPDAFVDVTYLIADEIFQNANSQVLTVKFRARGRSIAGGIYGVRLLKKDDTTD